MLNGKKYFLNVAATAVAAGIVFIVAFLYGNLLKPTAYGQNDSPPATRLNFLETSTAQISPTPTISITPTTSPAPTVSPSVIIDNNYQSPHIATDFSPLTLQAAAENSRLQYNLNWFFGGKSQRGWFLYVPLIQQTIGAKQNADTPEFANLVADWQQNAGLTPTSGKIDDKTLYKLIEYWQSRRLNNSDYPSPDKLLTAPIVDFYDPMREPELTKVERETYAAYKRMVAAAAKDKTLNLKTTALGEFAPDEKFLKIVSAFRSREYQEKLRRESPNSGRAGLATNSPHFTGRALDVYVGGEPVTTKDFNRAFQVQTPVYKWLVKNAERFGFVSYFYEPWHWEYIPEQLRKSDSASK